MAIQPLDADDEDDSLVSDLIDTNADFRHWSRNRLRRPENLSLPETQARTKCWTGAAIRSSGMVMFILRGPVNMVVRRLNP